MTKIDWCDETINPFTGCTNGCKYCYARRMARRFAGKKGTVYSRLKKLGHDPFRPAFHSDKFAELQDRLAGSRKRKRIFLGSMSDVADKGDWIITNDPHHIRMNTTLLQRMIFKFCERLPRQTFLMLTKHPENFMVRDWPANVHLGVSVTSTAEAGKLVPYLVKEITAAVRWASVEPLLDPDFDPEKLRGLDWVVIGAQTGPHAPEPLAAAAWRIRLWCLDHAVPCFVKDNMSASGQYPWPEELPI